MTENNTFTSDLNLVADGFNDSFVGDAPGLTRKMEEVDAASDYLNVNELWKWNNWNSETISE